MTLSEIIETIINGDVPEFGDLDPHFSGLDLWHVRHACFGDMNGAINFCNVHDLKWHVGYDNLAQIDNVKVISVTPAHALIIAALASLEKRRAGTEAATARQ